MLLVRRPRPPTEFTLSARVARSALSSLVHAGAALSFDDSWSAHKHILAAAQHGRCGYCDEKVLQTNDGTVDHYRPKAEIGELYDDPTTWGDEAPYSASVRNRRVRVLHNPGYHWFAHTWGNYVFACSSCNSKWKRTIFPVASGARRLIPGVRVREEPLLMHCYRRIRPSEHLVFLSDGQVQAVPGSQYGFETIRTVGLYREPLRDRREEVASRVFLALRQLVDADAGSREEAFAVQSLLDLGRENRSFAGVTRAIVEQNVGVTWESFVHRFA